MLKESCNGIITQQDVVEKRDLDLVLWGLTNTFCSRCFKLYFDKVVIEYANLFIIP